MDIETRFINQTKAICFCTVSMNRLNHLKKTLPINIWNNSKYKNARFILLDYNSTDGLESWVKENMFQEIEKGKLVYYKTFEPQYFHRSHSRNMAFRLADGDVVCNIDADNFTGQDFAAYLNDFFSKELDAFLTAQNNLGKVVQNDIMGRVAVRNVDFYSARGYDECMKGYGYEDHDFVNRLEMMKIKRHVIDNPEYLGALKHEDSLRICNEYSIRSIHSVLIGHVNPSASEIVLLFYDGHFERGTIINNATLNASIPSFQFHSFPANFEFQILQHDWVKGEWTKYNHNEIAFYVHNKSTERLYYKSEENCYVDPDDLRGLNLYEFKEQKIFEEILFFHSQISNRIKMLKNKTNSSSKVNESSFGNGIVFRNFNYSSPIII